MSKNDEIFLKAKEVSILDVIGQYTQLKRAGSCYTGLNPLRHDRHAGSLKVYPKTNTWIDYADPDDMHGDAADFVAKIEGISTLEAAKKIAGITGDLPAASAPVKRKKVRHNKKKDADYLDKVYTAFVRSCGELSSEHRENLLNIRKIKEKDLDLFFEFPDGGETDFWKRFTKNLKKQGFEGRLRDILFSVPGFAWDNASQRVIFPSYKGIGIIQMDLEGRIAALQVRVDHGEPRYKLFSSGYADLEGEDENPTGGASIGQTADVLFSKKEKGFVITEGRFKQYLLKRRGATTLSLNGVSAVEPAKAFSAYAKERGADKVIIAFDADFRSKRGVRSAALKLCQIIEDAGLTPCFYIWDEKYGKGIDDFILNPSEDKGEIRLISKEEWQAV